MKNLIRLIKLKAVCILATLILTAGLFVVEQAAYALTDTTAWTTIVPSGVNNFDNNAVVTENNDIYALYNNNMLIKYTYATGTWGTPQNIKVGGANKSASSYIDDDFIYKNGIFYMTYTSGEQVYYTSSADPFNFPAATLLGYGNTYATVINVRNDGKVAIYYGFGSDRGTHIYSNYSGAFVNKQMGTYSSMALDGIYFPNDNTVYVYRHYESSGDGSYTAYAYFDTFSWNGSTWTGTPNSSYYDDESPTWELFPYAKQFFYPDTHIGSFYYRASYAENVGGILFSAKYGTSSSYMQNIYSYGNFNTYISKVSSSDRASYIKKLNNQDGRLVLFSKSYISSASKWSLNVCFSDYFTPQPLTVAGNTTNSISVNHTQGDNPSFITTSVRSSLYSNMATYLETKTMANSGGASTAYPNTFAGLLPSTRYYFRSEVADGFGRTKYSSTISRCTIPSVPTNVTFTNIGSKSLTINYTANQNGTGTGYSIERSLTGNPVGSDWVEIYQGTNLYFDDTNLTSKLTYFYRIRAKNLENEWGGYTAVFPVQTLDKDNVAPTISLTVNNGNYVLMDSVLPVKAVVGDNRTANALLTYSYSINGFTWTSPVTVSTATGIINLNVSHGLTTSGDLNFQLRVYDEDGNVGIANAKVYYQKPSELPSAPTGESMTTAGAASLSIGSLDSESVYFTAKTTIYLDMSTQTQPKYQLKLDNYGYGDITPISTKATVHLGTEGLHILKIRQINSAGIAGIEKEYKIVIDKTAPAVDISFTESKTFTSSGTIAVRVSGSDNISTVLKYRVNGGAWGNIPVSGLISLSLTSGLNTLVVDIGDDAGLYTTKTLKIWRS